MPLNHSTRPTPLWPLWLILLCAIAARAWLLFSTPLVPGINGAYYLVQSRSLLEKGVLGIPDLPLTFLLQSSLARLFLSLGGLPLETAVLNAVKLADAVLPALLAIPMYLLFRTWIQCSNNWPTVLLTEATVLSAPLLSMAGEFQKNSLGLVWLGFLIWSLLRWLQDPKRDTATWVIGFMALGSITHIAVFGTMCVLFGTTLALHFWKQPEQRSQILAVAGGVAVACSVTGLIVLLKFDPSRVHRLTSAFLHPVQFLSGHKMPGLLAGHLGAPPPGGGPGGPFSSLGSVVFLSFAGLGLLQLRRNRASLAPATFSVVAASAVTLIVITGPWITGDKPMRFQLIAIPIVVLIAGFITNQLHSWWTRLLAWLPLSLALVVASVPLLGRGGNAQLSNEEFAELGSVSSQITSPNRTLVVARHGMEWWAAWILHTHVAQPTAVREDDWQQFQSVLFLKHIGGMRPPSMAGFLSFRPPGPPPGHFFNPPPTGTGRPAEGAATENSGNPKGPGGRPPMPGGPMAEPVFPEDALLFHDGKAFKIAEVKEAPAFVRNNTKPPEVPH